MKYIASRRILSIAAVRSLTLPSAIHIDERGKRECVEEVRGGGMELEEKEVVAVVYTTSDWNCVPQLTVRFQTIQSSRSYSSRLLLFCFLF